MAQAPIRQCSFMRKSGPALRAPFMFKRCLLLASACYFSWNSMLHFFWIAACGSGRDQPLPAAPSAPGPLRLATRRKSSSSKTADRQGCRLKSLECHGRGARIKSQPAPLAGAARCSTAVGDGLDSVGRSLVLVGANRWLVRASSASCTMRSTSGSIAGIAGAGGPCVLRIGRPRSPDGGGPRGGIDRRRARSAGVVTRQGGESVWRSDDSQRGSGARWLVVCGH
jgi:hypothetical protein